MKTIQNIKPDTQISIKKKQKKELKWIGRAKHINGTKLFQLKRNLKVIEIKIEKVEVIDINKKSKATHKAYIDPNLPIIRAINKKNAIRKFGKYLIQEADKQKYLKANGIR